MSYSSEVLADAPILYWGLDTTAGTEADLGSGGHTLTYQAGVVRGVSGLTPSDGDTAAYFDGVGGISYCTSPNVADVSFTAGPFTVECLIKANLLTGSLRIVCKGHVGAGGWGFGTQGAGLKFTTFGIKDFTSLKLPLVLGTPYHLVAVYTAADDVDYYVNGTFLETVTHTVALTASTDLVTVGSDGTPANDVWVGKIGKVAVYSSALSAARILAHYNAAVDLGFRFDYSLFPKAILRSPVPVRW